MPATPAPFQPPPASDDLLAEIEALGRKVAAARRVSCSCAAASKPDVELADEELADVELVSALTSTRSSSVASPASVLRHQ